MNRQVHLGKDGTVGNDHHNDAEVTNEPAVPEQVSVAMNGIGADMREGLPTWNRCGPKGKYNPRTGSQGGMALDRARSWWVDAGCPWSGHGCRSPTGRDIPVVPTICSPQPRS